MLSHAINWPDVYIPNYDDCFYYKALLLEAFDAFHNYLVFMCIALLTVNDDEFWEGVSPVEFGTLPALQDAVTVVGYPIGGDTISVTSGVVSRMEILSYVHGSTELLGLQVQFWTLYSICSLLHLLTQVTSNTLFYMYPL